MSEQAKNKNPKQQGMKGKKRPKGRKEGKYWKGGQPKPRVRSERERKAAAGVFPSGPVVSRSAPASARSVYR